MVTWLHCSTLPPMVHNGTAEFFITSQVMSPKNMHKIVSMETASDTNMEEQPAATHRGHCVCVRVGSVQTDGLKWKLKSNRFSSSCVSFSPAPTPVHTCRKTCEAGGESKQENRKDPVFAAGPTCIYNHPVIRKPHTHTHTQLVKQQAQTIRSLIIFREI